MLDDDMATGVLATVPTLADVPRGDQRRRRAPTGGPTRGATMEIDVQLARTVAAPAADCWQLLTDPSRAHEWITIVSSARAEGEPGPGRIIHARGGLLGITTTTRQQVHLWEPERGYGWRGDDPFPLVVECRLDETPDGTTLRLDAGADPGRFFPVGTSVVRRAVHRQLHRSADRFQQIVEGR